MTAAPATRFTRKELLASWKRGHERARHLGLDAGCVVDDPAVLPDAELLARLWRLSRWVARAEQTDWPFLFGEFRRAGGFEGMALREGDDVREASEVMRKALAWFWEIEAAMKGALV